MKRIMCVRMPAWAIERVKRRRPSLRDKPLALVETGQRPTIVAACDAAQRTGVRVGMTPAHAHALCVGLVALPPTPKQDAVALEALGRWMMAHVSSQVVVAPPDVLLVEVGGSVRLFGGIDVIARKTVAAMRRLRFTAVVSVAPTAGAAWALAATNHGVLVDEADVLTALRPLPVAALRVPPAVAATLSHLGVDTVGQLIALPRASLPARFGQVLLDRIDHATGRLPEPLDWLPPRRPLVERIAFDGPIDSLEAVWHVLGELVGRAAAELSRRGSGASELCVRFDREKPPPLVKTVVLSRPSREHKNLLGLLRLATENLSAGEGFIAIELAVPRLHKIAAEQATLAPDEPANTAAEMASLIERLRAKLGGGGVVRPRLIESHVPERAYEWTATDATATIVAADRVAPPRPMVLLREPVPIGVMVLPSHDCEGRPVSFTVDGQFHELRLVLGPERISGTWWTGHNKTRDYFDVEDSAGCRFWVFRVTQTFKWYLHGLFE